MNCAGLAHVQLTGGEAVSLPGPGELPLLARVFSLAGLRPGSRVVDVGCGDARSTSFLRAQFGLRAFGLDLNCAAGARPGVPRLVADAGCLPLADGAVDAVLLACVLSATADPGRVLHECVRVLTWGGKLVLADLYSRGPRRGAVSSALAGGRGARLLPLTEWKAALQGAGLCVEVWEDHSSALREHLFRLIMEGGDAERACAAALRPVGERCLPAARPGYLVLIASRA